MVGTWFKIALSREQVVGWHVSHEIAALLTQAAAIDMVEDAAYGPDVRGDELPAELQRREDRLATIAAAKARLEARQAEEDRQKGRTLDDGRKGRGHKPFARDFGVPPADAQDNFTDPESRIMKTSYGFDQWSNRRAPRGPHRGDPPGRRSPSSIRAPRGLTQPSRPSLGHESPLASAAIIAPLTVNDRPGSRKHYRRRSPQPIDRPSHTPGAKSNAARSTFW